MNEEIEKLPDLEPDSKDIYKIIKDKVKFLTYQIMVYLLNSGINKIKKEMNFEGKNLQKIEEEEEALKEYRKQLKQLFEHFKSEGLGTYFNEIFKGYDKPQELNIFNYSFEELEDNKQKTIFIIEKIFELIGEDINQLTLEEVAEHFEKKLLLWKLLLWKNKNYNIVKPQQIKDKTFKLSKKLHKERGLLYSNEEKTLTKEKRTDEVFKNAKAYYLISGNYKISYILPEVYAYEPTLYIAPLKNLYALIYYLQHLRSYQKNDEIYSFMLSLRDYAYLRGYTGQEYQGKIIEMLEKDLIQGAQLTTEIENLLTNEKKIYLPLYNVYVLSKHYYEITFKNAIDDYLRLQDYFNINIEALQDKNARNNTLFLFYILIKTNIDFKEINRENNKRTYKTIPLKISTILNFLSKTDLKRKNYLYKTLLRNLKYYYKDCEYLKINKITLTTENDFYIDLNIEDFKDTRKEFEKVLKEKNLTDDFFNYKLIFEYTERLTLFEPYKEITYKKQLNYSGDTLTIKPTETPQERQEIKQRFKEPEPYEDMKGLIDTQTQDRQEIREKFKEPQHIQKLMEGITQKILEGQKKRDT